MKLHPHAREPFRRRVLLLIIAALFVARLVAVPLHLAAHEHAGDHVHHHHSDGDDGRDPHGQDQHHPPHSVADHDPDVIVRRASEPEARADLPLRALGLDGPAPISGVAVERVSDALANSPARVAHRARPPPVA